MRALLFLIALAFVVSCKQSKKSGEVEETPIQTEAQVEALAQKGEKTLSTYCYQCHNPEVSMDNMLAPPMIAVKNHYITEETTKEEFMADLRAWMAGPSEEKSKMPGALEKFGLMNHQIYPDSVITVIGEYLYDNEVAEPEWYQEHHEEMHGKGKGKGMGAGQGKGQKKGGQ